MPAPTFHHQDLKLVKPSFDSHLTDLIIELDYLRKKPLQGSTHPQVFFQLKHIFHLLESIESARIEGNNTTIAEYIETKVDAESKISAGIKEIQNIENAMLFVEEHIQDIEINSKFISELHQIIVQDLSAKEEGDKTPGNYRRNNLIIAKSTHLPPDWIMVEEYMRNLFDFINENHGSKYDLLKAALAHHRFVWIHPFGNGNGRTVRVFTYAMLVKAGFNVNVGRILNPTAVFCSNRKDYYDHLSYADAGTEAGMLKWVEYVLKGLKEEIEKIDRLLDYQYLRKEILAPAIAYALTQKYITGIESQILKTVIEKQLIQAADIKGLFSGKANTEISRQLKKLIEKKMLMPENKGSRKYLIRFDNNYLMRAIIKQLAEKGFLPIKDEII